MVWMWIRAHMSGWEYDRCLEMGWSKGSGYIRIANGDKTECGILLFPNPIVFCSALLVHPLSASWESKVNVPTSVSMATPAQTVEVGSQLETYGSGHWLYVSCTVWVLPHGEVKIPENMSCIFVCVGHKGIYSTQTYRLHYFMAVAYNTGDYTHFLGVP